MGKDLVLYQSKYGASRSYAEWLGAAWGCPACALQDCKGGLGAYQRIVLVGGLYAGSIAGLKRFFRLCEGTPHERAAVLCVGASPYDADTLAACKARGFGAGWQDVPLFYARGRLDMAQLNPVDRALCRMLCKSVARKEIGGPERPRLPGALDAGAAVGGGRPPGLGRPRPAGSAAGPLGQVKVAVPCSMKKPTEQTVSTDRSQSVLKCRTFISRRPRVPFGNARAFFCIILTIFLGLK